MTTPPSLLARTVVLASLCGLLAGIVALPGGNAAQTFCVDSDVVSLAGVAYVAIDQIDTEFVTLWIYAEHNGIEGLQRGGTTLLGDTDVCQDFENHDLGVF